MNHELLLGVQRIVRGGGVGQAVSVHAIVNDVISRPPDDHRKRRQVGELRSSARNHFPEPVTDARGGQNIGVNAVGNDCRAIRFFCRGIVGVHQKHRRCRHACESEERAGIVVRHGVSSGVGRNDEKEVGLVGDELAQFHDMTGHQSGVGDAEVQIGTVRSVADDGGSRLARLPGDGEHADFSGGRHTADH